MPTEARTSARKAKPESSSMLKRGCATASETTCPIGLMRAAVRSGWTDLTASLTDAASAEGSPPLARTST
jgi:hypothetical protein